MVHYKRIVRRVIDALGADSAVNDLARVLRVPGYLHQKNPAEPFLVKEVYRRRVTYTERQMLTAFSPTKGEKRMGRLCGVPKWVMGVPCFESLQRVERRPLIIRVSCKGFASPNR